MARIKQKDLFTTDNHVITKKTVDFYTQPLAPCVQREATVLVRF